MYSQPWPGWHFRMMKDQFFLPSLGISRAVLECSSSFPAAHHPQFAQTVARTRAVKGVPKQYHFQSLSNRYNTSSGTDCGTQFYSGSRWKEVLHQVKIPTDFHSIWSGCYHTVPPLCCRPASNLLDHSSRLFDNSFWIIAFPKSHCFFLSQRRSSFALRSSSSPRGARTRSPSRGRGESDDKQKKQRGRQGWVL